MHAVLRVRSLNGDYPPRVSHLASLSGGVEQACLETSEKLVWKRPESLFPDVWKACLETCDKLVWRRVASLSGDVWQVRLETSGKLV